MNSSKFNQAIQKFDDYNRQDPTNTNLNGNEMPYNLLYGHRMSAKLQSYAPNASEHLQLAARCQHIGRWEIPRQDYPMDRKGYLQWRSQLKILHGNIAEVILEEVGYEKEIIQMVKDLLMKKQLKQNSETQILEDVICLVFLEYYFDDFAGEHTDEKLVSILKKTIVKMSDQGIEQAMKLSLSVKTQKIVEEAIK